MSYLRHKPFAKFFNVCRSFPFANIAAFKGLGTAADVEKHIETCTDRAKDLFWEASREAYIYLMKTGEIVGVKLKPIDFQGLQGLQGLQLGPGRKDVRDIAQDIVTAERNANDMTNLGLISAAREALEDIAMKLDCYI